MNPDRNRNDNALSNVIDEWEISNQGRLVTGTLRISETDSQLPGFAQINSLFLH